MRNENCPALCVHECNASTGNKDLKQANRNFTKMKNQKNKCFSHVLEQSEVKFIESFYTKEGEKPYEWHITRRRRDETETHG